LCLRSKKAFTLIELLMTIIVVSIVAIPLSLLVSQHMVSVFQSQDYTLALNWARFEMEKANNIPYANLGVGSTVWPHDNYQATRTVSVVQASGAEGLKKIQVDVRKIGETPVLASLVTYLVNNVSYGI